VAQTRPAADAKNTNVGEPAVDSFMQSIGFRWSEPASAEGLPEGVVSTPVVVIYSTPSDNGGKIYTIRIYLPDGDTGGTRSIDINLSINDNHPGLGDLHLAGSDQTPESVPAPDLQQLLSSTSLFY
jgi:hypothetical protein